MEFHSKASLLVVKTAQSLFFGWFLALFPGEWGWEKPRYPREVKRGSCNALTKRLSGCKGHWKQKLH